MTDSDKLLKVIQACYIEPCHTTGMHDPTHTPRYICADQKAEAFDRVMKALTEAGVDGVPKRMLHRNGCYWCHNKAPAKRDNLKQWLKVGCVKPKA